MAPDSGTSLSFCMRETMSDYDMGIDSTFDFKSTIGSSSSISPILILVVSFPISYDSSVSDFSLTL